ncbi:unnamed protein product [Caretta caretta]
MRESISPMGLPASASSQILAESMGGSNSTCGIKMASEGSVELSHVPEAVNGVTQGATGLELWKGRCARTWGV